MEKIIRNIALVIFIFFCTSTIAQNPLAESQIAQKYYQSKEFDKASELYKKLYENTNSPTYFNFYIKCLIELKQFDEAEKTIKKQQRRNPDDITYYIELGHLYKLTGNSEKAIDEYNKGIKKVAPSQSQIINIANAFTNKQEYEYAEKVYLQGRRMLNGQYGFNLELAYIYQIQRAYEKMINEYLDLLIYSDVHLSLVQSRLQTALSYDIDNSLQNILKTSILRYLQRFPDAVVLNELLIWQYLQEKDFSKALRQAISIDKRNKETGNRIIQLGQMALGHQVYDVASDAFQYVMDKGEGLPYYITAEYEYLNAKYLQVVNKINYTNDELIQLENDYLNAIKKYNNPLPELIMNLAHIKAFYLNKPYEAIRLLENSLQGAGKNAGIYKIKLADIYLLVDNPWESTLYYAQAEKENENNTLGHEAKFKKAKLAYYTGNFFWAQAQLDVLKASTSKLISNDAFALAMLISNNTALDTTTDALLIYARADFLLFQNKDSMALITLDSLIKQFKSHSLVDEALYLKAQIFIKQKKYSLAAEYLEKITQSYSYDILADNALFKLAELNETVFNNPEKAKQLYQDFIIRYPNSLYFIQARNNFRRLRGDKVHQDDSL